MAYFVSHTSDSLCWLGQFFILLVAFSFLTLGCSESEIDPGTDYKDEPIKSAAAFTTSEAAKKGKKVYERMKENGASKEDANRDATETSKKFGQIRELDRGTKVEVIEKDEKLPSIYTWVRVKDGYYKGKEFVIQKENID